LVNDQRDAQIPFYEGCRLGVNSQPTHDTATDSYQRLCWYNLSLLMMSTMCSKHVES